MCNYNLIIIGKERVILNFEIDTNRYNTFNDITNALINDLSNQIEDNDEYITLYGSKENINIYKGGFDEIIIYTTNTKQTSNKIIGRIDYEDLL